MSSFHLHSSYFQAAHQYVETGSQNSAKHCKAVEAYEATKYRIILFDFFPLRTFKQLSKPFASYQFLKMILQVSCSEFCLALMSYFNLYNTTHTLGYFQATTQKNHHVKGIR